MRALLLVLAIGCSSQPPPPTPGCDPGAPGFTSTRPLAVVGDRVSDRLELYTIDPVEQVGCVGLDENPDFIDEPFDLAATRDFLYVVLGHADHYTSGTLVKFHLPDGEKRAELSLGEEPSMIAIDGNRAYVALFRNLQMLQGPWTAPGAVVIVDLDAMQIVDQVEVCNAALGVAIDPDRKQLWVACAGSDALALVDVSGPARLLRTIPLDDGAGHLGKQPAYLVLDGKHTFVTAQASDDLWIFDQASGDFVKRIAFESGTFPQRMALLPGAPVLLVALDYVEALAAVDTNALTVADRVPLTGVRAQGIAVYDHFALVTDEHDLMHPGRLARVELNGLGAGGAHLDGSAPAAVFPQAVLVLP